MTRKPLFLEQLQALVDPVADAIIEMSPQEFLTFQKSIGLNPDAEQKWVKDLIATVTGTSVSTPIEATQQALQGIRHKKTPPAIPRSAKDRRSLLERLMRSDNGLLPQELTLAFREGKNLSDNDIEGLLEDLADLGILDVSDDK